MFWCMIGFDLNELLNCFKKIPSLQAHCKTYKMYCLWSLILYPSEPILTFNNNGRDKVSLLF